MKLFSRLLIIVLSKLDIHLETGKLKTIFAFNCDELFSMTQLRAGAKLASMCQITRDV